MIKQCSVWTRHSLVHGHVLLLVQMAFWWHKDSILKMLHSVSELTLMELYSIISIFVLFFLFQCCERSFSCCKGDDLWGHAGRAHKKQLVKLAKMRLLSDDFKRKHCEKFPTVNEVSWCCPNRNFPGCGCQKLLLHKHVTIFHQYCLRQIQQIFAERLLVLARHTCNEHKWDGGQCDFYHLNL